MKLSNADRRSRALTSSSGALVQISKHAFGLQLNGFALLACYAILTAYAES